MGLLNEFLAQLAALQAVWQPFVIALVAIAIAVWTVAKGHYSGRLATKNERIKHLQERVDDYKDKLAGATPEEAKRKIEVLEEKVAKLTRYRSLTPEQSAILTATAQANPWETGGLDIMYPVTSHEAATFATEIAKALAAGGWYVNPPGHSMDGPRIGPRGLTLALPKNGGPFALADALADALQKAGIAFRRESFDRDGPRLFVDVIEEG